MPSTRYPQDPDSWRCSECGAEYDGHASARGCRGSIAGCSARICSDCQDEAVCQCSRAACRAHRRITADESQVCDRCRAEDAIAEMVFADIAAEFDLELAK